MNNECQRRGKCLTALAKLEPGQTFTRYDQKTCDHFKLSRINKISVREKLIESIITVLLGVTRRLDRKLYHLYKKT